MTKPDQTILDALREFPGSVTAQWKRFASLPNLIYTEGNE
jgi:hypothetical protein